MTNGAGADIVSHFQAGLDVLRRYPVLMVPPIAMMVVAFGLALVFIGGAATAFAVGGVAGGFAGFLGGVLLFGLLTVLLGLIASAVVIVMARDALAGREPALGDALGVVMGRLGDVLVASIVAMIIVGLGMALFVLPGLIAAVFLFFALPAVLLDGEGGIDALRRSASFVRANLGPVIGLVIGGILVGIVVAVASRVLELVPFVGWLASAALAGVSTAYISVVVVRFYQALQRPGRP